MKKPKDKRLFVAKEMPPLRRKQKDEKYTYKDDQVLKWIAQRPGLLCYVFDKLSAGGYITYDPATGLWKGVNYDE